MANPVASLPKKTPEAMIASLDTELVFPLYWTVRGSAYDPGTPYPPKLIAMAAANFDRLPENTQAALLDAEWDRVVLR